MNSLKSDSEIRRFSLLFVSLKPPRIIAMNRLRKMKVTMSKNVVKYRKATEEPHPTVLKLFAT